MSAVVFKGTHYDLIEDESVLDGLLRYGLDIPNGCRSGICQACILVANDGVIPAVAQKGLSASQVKLNHFLSCQCQPELTIDVRQSDESLTTTASINSVSWLNDSVIQLTIKANVEFIAGQYVTLINSNGVARSYSIANSPNDADLIEFHIKCIADGAFSQWLTTQAKVGEALSLCGPMGKCIYSEKPEQALLMASMGTGLAPIFGVLKQALRSGHQAPIHLFIGNRHAKDFYLVEALQALAAKYNNLHLEFICLDGENHYATKTDFYKAVSQKLPNLKGFDVYLCGGENFVKKLRKQSFLAGAGMSDIYADVFLPFAK